MAVKAFPLRLKALYMVQSCDDVDRNSVLNEIVPTALQFTGSFVGKLAVPVYGDTKEEILQMLIHEGFSRSGVPPK